MLWSAGAQEVDNTVDKPGHKPPKRAWRKALGRTKRAQELRQASPLPTVLPDHVRNEVVAQAKALKKGVVIGDVEIDPSLKELH